MKAAKLCLSFIGDGQDKGGVLFLCLILNDAKELHESLFASAALSDGETEKNSRVKESLLKKEIFFISAEVAKASTEILATKAQELYAQLKYFLAPTHFVSTFLTSSPELSQLRFEAKKIFYLDAQIEQPELRLARSLWPVGQELLREPETLAFVHDALEKKKMLLHICCGPDAAGVINQLKRDYEVVCFWYDPNIQPRAEHDKRLEAFKQVAEIEQVPYIVGEYDVEHFYERIEGLEHTPEQGAKCSHCYDMRLDRAAREARAQNCDYYTTTLAISPHKVQEKLKNFGELNEAKYQIPYYTKNFMKDEGFKKSVEYTAAYNIYRQDYCGCYYSLHEGGRDAKVQAKALGLESCDLPSIERFKRSLESLSHPEEKSKEFR